MGVLFSCALPSAGQRSVILDPQFAYYRDRSAESIVSEIRANGYREVRLVCVNESGIDGELVRAFADAGVRVWMLTFANGVYSTADLPEGWESWRMKQRKPSSPDGFIYLCPNNPAFRAWKKARLVFALKKHPFYGVDLAEPFFPAYQGPESEHYGCFCDSCVAGFRGMYSTDPPDFEDPESPRYWKNDSTLYEKWVGFRVSAVVNHLDDLVNGGEGLREKCPRAKVATWSLALDTPDAISKLREWVATDGAAIVRRVKPDAHVIQTDWPDWIKTNLPGDYPLRYREIAASIRSVSPLTPLVLQTDIGSKDNMRRSREWIGRAEKAALEIGCRTSIHYEYHLGDYIYAEPPAPVSAAYETGKITLVFNKRLDSVSASNIANYTLGSGQVDYAKVDGNMVVLSVSGAQGGVTVEISNLSDDESRRFFHDRPACAMAQSVRITAQ